MSAFNHAKYLFGNATEYTLEIANYGDSLSDLMIDKSLDPAIREYQKKLIKEHIIDGGVKGEFYIVNASRLERKNTIYRKDATPDFGNMYTTNTDIIFTLPPTLQSKLTHNICFYKYNKGSSITFHQNREDPSKNVARILPIKEHTTIFKCDRLNRNQEAEYLNWFLDMSSEVFPRNNRNNFEVDIDLDSIEEFLSEDTSECRIKPETKKNLHNIIFNEDDDNEPIYVITENKILTHANIGNNMGNNITTKEIKFRLPRFTDCTYTYTKDSDVTLFNNKAMIYPNKDNTTIKGPAGNQNRGDALSEEPKNSDYTILGIKNSAGQDAIKAAYRKRVLQTHPNKGGDAEEFRRVQEAYERLTNKNGGRRTRARKSKTRKGKARKSKFKRTRKH